MLRVRWVVLACLAGCGVRTPAAIDVDGLVRARGPLEARRDLEIRATSDPRDVAARLALASLDEQLGRPSEAIDALEQVVALGGPLGVRWREPDRLRLGRLLAARGRARLARGAARALADLSRARTLGIVSDGAGADLSRALGSVSDARAGADLSRTRTLGSVSDARAGADLSRARTGVSGAEVREAQVVAALAQLRHSDAETRDAGRRTLSTDERWLGARPSASPAQRGSFGAWLWAQGARRAAWDELSAWHDQSPAPRDPALQAAYLAASRWWTPLDRPGPPADELSGVGLCAFGGCQPHQVVGDEGLERAYLLAPLPPPVTDPSDVAALVVITLHATLRGESPWGPALAARIDLAAFSEPARLASLPRFARPIIARFAGLPVPDPGDGETADQRLVVAAAHLLASEPVSPTGDAAPLRALIAPRDAVPGDARSEAAARHAAATIAFPAPVASSIALTTARDGASSATRDGVSSDARDSASSATRDGAPAAVVDTLRAIAAAYHRDPLLADRLGRDAVASASDAALAHAALGALFDALGDPSRARGAWQAAVDASPEPAFLRGLAEAQARQGDGDAALVTATAASAASGDPAVVWLAVARALAATGKDVYALDAARSALDLAGPDVIAGALDVAIGSSRALGRDDQVAQLTAQRARLIGSPTLRDDDPTAPNLAQPTDRLWLASRWNPRNVPLRAALLSSLATDPRRATLIAELLSLATDPDPDVRRAAVAALR